MARAAKEEAAPSDATPASHAARVFAVAEGQASAPGAAFVSTSWQRCVNEFGVDPAASVAPRVLTLPELRHLREPIKALIESARDELDRLYALVRPAGYTVLLADKNGVAVEHRGDEAQAGTFKYWGIWLGGVWTESVEGTNGIGTCIAEAQPVTIHRNQHLRSRHIDLSCSGAPIFDVDGTLLAVLDVSSFDPTLSEGAHTLTGTLTAMSARSIEERF
ncbi:MAG TPA: GAF domain-containing protein, partial [Stellaceae bacterium]|nr:GAF domain-containing protein [Stellaceae bacterium]